VHSRLSLERPKRQLPNITYHEISLLPCSAHCRPHRRSLSHGGIAPRPVQEKSHTHRFPLTEHDVKESAEAPKSPSTPAGASSSCGRQTLGERTHPVAGDNRRRRQDVTQPRVVARSGILKAKIKGREVRMAPHVAVSDGACIWRGPNRRRAGGRSHGGGHVRQSRRHVFGSGDGASWRRRPRDLHVAGRGP